MPFGKRARQKADRPGEILEAALEVFVQDGYRAARMESVATKIGVTKGTIYLYFDTKEKLFAEVIRRFTPSIEGSQLPIASGTSISEQLRAYIRFFYAHVASNSRSREVFHLLISEGRHFPNLIDRHFSEFIKPALEHVAGLLRRGAATGEFRPVAAERFPQILLGPAVVLNIWMVVFDQRNPLAQAKYIDAHLDLLFAGLRSDAANVTQINARPIRNVKRLKQRLSSK